jgi:hypothetical protein
MTDMPAHRRIILPVTEGLFVIFIKFSLGRQPLVSLALGSGVTSGGNFFLIRGQAKIRTPKHRKT